MSTTEKTRSIKRPQVGRSVEVQHARKGVSLMLRRGLHGAKNWTLEPDSEGNPRSAWAKVARFCVVLIPLWIVLSATTGGPERGGQQQSIPGALFSAVLATVVGLGVFSARERRAGREEPWADLPNLITESDDEAEEEVSVPEVEQVASIPEKEQVGEVDLRKPSLHHEGNSDTEGDFGPIDSDGLHDFEDQATLRRGASLAAEDPEAATEALHPSTQQATTEGANWDEEDRTYGAELHGYEEAPTKPLHAPVSTAAFPQVNAYATAMHDTFSEGGDIGSEWNIEDVTEGDDFDAPERFEDSPTLMLRRPVQEPLRQEDPVPEFPQVNATEGPLPQPLQGELQVEYATRGPYPVDGEVPIDWWLTKPDVEPEEGAAEEAVGEVRQESGPEPEPEVEPEGTGKGAAPETSGSLLLSRLPEVVVLFLATRSSSAAITTEEREVARENVVTWAREEIEAKRLSQAKVAEMLSVDKSTVNRWLNAARDPWS